MKHTPGPWESIKSVKDRRLNIIQARGGMMDLYQIAKVKSALDCDQGMASANAALIAAAPDLLKALKTIANHKGALTGADASCFIQIAKRAIAFGRKEEWDSSPWG